MPDKYGNVLRFRLPTTHCLPQLADRINPEWVELHKSRGIETYAHKLYMRSTVLVADLLIYIPAVVLYCYITLKDKTPSYRLLSSAVILLYPGLMLIDHGHFQYNCISLGLTLWAIIGMLSGRELLGSMAFVLALNYKQMELYHALPFFCFLFGRCVQLEKKAGLWKLIKIGCVVIVTFLLCWLPFLGDFNLASQVLHRLFPFSRGLFEDKVANFWCSLSVVVKLKNIFTQQSWVFMTFYFTMIFHFPSCIHLLFKPSTENFKAALVNSSLIFFLFSYQVHEKSILLPALSVCLLLPRKPFFCLWFLIMSTFSMLPLLIKDGLVLPYTVTMLLFLITTCYVMDTNTWKLAVFENPPTEILKSVMTFSSAGFIQAWFYVCLIEIGILSWLSVFKAPPPKYPDLWPVIISVFCCLHFLAFLVYFHIEQFFGEHCETLKAKGTKSD
ncbi:dolichyl pyrophosphate Man9GlcNAc2 alpha-1,3-glucosyltransferase-like [Saccoglossus kowalevskii]